MRTIDEEITYTADNNVVHNRVYDLLHTPTDPYFKSCLNVYGRRMFIEKDKFLLRRADGTRVDNEKYKIQPETGVINNGGFNYTGL